jgi:processive 1,2-diacylglycerol beta-glucosyltransferase
VKSILILTASFGEGHNAAARNLREALTAVLPITKVPVSDPFMEAYGRFNRLCAKAYLGVINHLPSVWQKAFDILDRTKLVEQHMSLYGVAADRLERLLDEHRPDTVVSVYPGCNHLLDYVARRRVRRSYRTVTIITDSLTINSVWLRAHSDVFLVANEATADIVRKAGVPAEKIFAPGFPVPRVFAALGGRDKAPPPNGPWKVLYVVNSGRHVAPAIVRELLTLENVALTVTVGRDEKLRNRIAAVSKTAPPEIHGWTPELPRLMAENHLLISKAGGATVQETLAACTPMIITQVVPGQEEGNARLILESGAGALATSPIAIAAAVREAIADGGRTWSAWRDAAASLSRPQASEEIAQYLITNDAARLRQVS